MFLTPPHRLFSKSCAQTLYSKASLRLYLVAGWEEEKGKLSMMGRVLGHNERPRFSSWPVSDYLFDLRQLSQVFYLPYRSVMKTESEDIYRICDRRPYHVVTQHVVLKM